MSGPVFNVSYEHDAYIYGLIHGWVYGMLTMVFVACGFFLFNYISDRFLKRSRKQT